eukprot:4347988-Prymnesium_polylepis.1
MCIRDSACAPAPPAAAAASPAFGGRRRFPGSDHVLARGQAAALLQSRAGQAGIPACSRTARESAPSRRAPTQ